MQLALRFSLAIVAVAALAGCSSAPGPLRVARAPAAVHKPIDPPYKWTHGKAPQAHKDMLATFSRGGLRPGEFVWSANVPADGETRIVIDRLTQMLYAYRGEQLVGAASVSTAKSGMITPLGFWSVLEKKRLHRSRKYDDAPMPFMQRIDEYGIAMHGGNNPGYPASHGCIRLPMKFAEKLYGLTRIGSKVVIEG